MGQICPAAPPLPPRIPPVRISPRLASLHPGEASLGLPRGAAGAAGRRRGAPACSLALSGARPLRGSRAALGGGRRRAGQRARLTCGSAASLRPPRSLPLTRAGEGCTATATATRLLPASVGRKRRRRRRASPLSRLSSLRLSLLPRARADVHAPAPPARPSVRPPSSRAPPPLLLLSLPRPAPRADVTRVLAQQQQQQRRPRRLKTSSAHPSFFFFPSHERGGRRRRKKKKRQERALSATAAIPVGPLREWRTAGWEGWRPREGKRRLFFFSPSSFYDARLGGAWRPPRATPG